MAEVSKLYTSKQTIYRRTSGKRTARSKHGDVKHIIFKDGQPQYTEIIRVGRDEETAQQKQNRSNPKRIKAKRTPGYSRRSSEEVAREKKEKLQNRLNDAARKSLTLWSEKDQIWISYQGSPGFLVKRFSGENRLLSSQLMSQKEIVDSAIPNLLDTSWEIV